jgi:hypothetical protein
VPRYQQALTFDIVRSVKNLQKAATQLQVQAPGLVRHSLNQVVASLNQNAYFWGGDVTGWNGFNGTFVVASDPPDGAPYPYAALFTIVSAAVGAALEESASPFNVLSLQQYIVSAWVNTPLTTVVLGFDWQDSTGTYISTTTQTITVTANTWTQVSAAGVAPSNAAFAYPRIAPTDGVGNAVYAQAIIVQQTNAAFQPGTTTPDTWHTISLAAGLTGNLVGGVGIRAKLVSAVQVLMEVEVQWSGSAATTFTCGSLPSASYYPAASRRFPLTTTSIISTTAPAVPRLFVPTTGGVQVVVPAMNASSTFQVSGNITYGTD